ncbi:MAG: glycoside hydrolase family 3 protein [Bacilli bacterium]|nr:glycoside hydrolase family 3 protein [Bacilli bacterium]
MAHNPKKKPGKKFLGISIGIASGLVVICTAAIIAANIYGGVLDKYLPQGAMHINPIPGSENWDSNYYKNDFNGNAEQTDAAAKKTTLDIASEGITLLKNDGLLPLKTGKTQSTDKKVTLFGRRGTAPIYGGTGSGAGDAGQCTSIIDALKEVGYDVNPTVVQMYQDNLANVPVNSGGMDQVNNTTSYIGEFPQSYFGADITSSYGNYKDAAIVVLGREGGEGLDFETDMKGSIGRADYGNSADVPETANYVAGQHQLELNKEERDLIDHVKANFDNVIVVINSANVMELGNLRDDPDINGIVWLGYPGSRGTIALANILCGLTNPSGHTVDIWPVDLSADPTFPNTNVQQYSNINSGNALGNSFFSEYEEGIYVGYRYYETVDADGKTFKIQGNDNATYEEAVAFPFGHGLSYTTFSQSLEEVKVEDDSVEAKVLVKNEGTVAGKEVIQLYYTAPYTVGGIEKSAVNLAAFKKTDMLEPGQSKEYALCWNVDQMASYDYKNHRCYVLDAGEYVISARKNSHEVYDAGSINVTQKVYDAANPRPSEIVAQKTGEGLNYSDEYLAKLTVNAALNHFDDVSAHFSEYNEDKVGAKNMTRKDFAASFPTAPTAQDHVASEELIKKFGAYSPDYIKDDDVAPKTGETGAIKLAELRGAPYDDARWDSLLDQLTTKDMTDVIYDGNQGTVAKTKIGLPSTKATDGPAGLKQYGGLGFGASGNFSCCGAILAATWNVEIAEQFGISVGNEAIIAKVSGWYAPGNDLHRSAFGGRNFEYYSEDPVLAGHINGATNKGCASKGLVCYTKHFAVNELERHRTENGPAIWVNEQALRELYLRAFEFAVIEPTVEIKYLSNKGVSSTKTIRATSGIMSSFTRIGSTWCGGSKALLSDVLRGEWGFQGTVITDYNSSPFMNVEEGVRAGNDLMLANAATLPTKFANTKNASSQLVLRKAMKNICYTVANSAATNGLSSGTEISFDLAPWRIGLIAGVSAGYVIAVGLLSLGLVKYFLAKKKAEAIEE